MTADSLSFGDKTSWPKSKSLPAPRFPRGGGAAASEFYNFCHAHELRFQRCTQCGTWRHIPRDMCAKCGSFDWEWARSSGKGKLFSWTTAMQPMMPQFKRQRFLTAPWSLKRGRASVIVLADRRQARRIGAPDIPLEVVFDDMTPTVTLPEFRRAA